MNDITKKDRTPSEFKLDIFTIVKSQVKHTTIGQKVYKKYSPQNVQVNG